MKRVCTILVFGLLVGLAPSAAQAKRSDFIGTWRNLSPGGAVWEIRVTSTYQVWVNQVNYAGILVSYGTSGAPDGHTTATIVYTSGSTTTTLVIGLGTLLNNGSDTNKLWCMRLVDLANLNSDGNTHQYQTFYRYTLLKPVAPTQVLAP
jgi:hypothetical protein